MTRPWLLPAAAVAAVRPAIRSERIAASSGCGRLQEEKLRQQQLQHPLLSAKPCRRPAILEPLAGQAVGTAGRAGQAAGCCCCAVQWLATCFTVWARTPAGLLMYNA
jgi:hypothetical protein